MTAFEAILAAQQEEEARRLYQPLRAHMLEEFELPGSVRRQLDRQAYTFPDFDLGRGTSPLVRQQAYFSAKPHHPDTHTYFHRHRFIELLYVYRGSCRQYLESPAQEVRVGEGELFLLNQNVAHAILPAAEGDVLIKIILPVPFLKADFADRLTDCPQLADFFRSALRERPEVYQYLLFRDLGQTQVRGLVERIVEEYFYRKPFYEQAVRNYLQLMAIELYRSSRCENVRRPLGALDMAAVTGAIARQCDAVTLGGLAAAFGYNPSYLSRAIRRQTGRTFQQLVTACRVDKAAGLLADTDWPVEDVAQAVGYGSASALFRHIRQATGLTPTQLRHRLAARPQPDGSGQISIAPR